MDIETLAHEAGLDWVGVAPAGPSPHWLKYREWSKRGFAADMTYLTRPDAVLKRQDPRHILPETKTILAVAVSYGAGKQPQTGPFEGLVSRYAWGEDYHHWLLARLKNLVRRISQAAEVPVKSRCYVDTGPILERSWAEAAGLGWIGKNTCLINPQLGSYMFLGIALINLELDAPRSINFPICGSCSQCIDACPTGALVAPGELNANRCISYLTIENKGRIPVELQPMIDNRVFGCDVCQDVCPWNKKVITDQPSSVPHTKKLDLREILELDTASFKSRFRSTPIWRTTAEGLARNAAVVLGNQNDAEVKAYAQHIGRLHPSPLVRKHLKWADNQ